jgi:hypothetical protein
VKKEFKEFEEFKNGSPHKRQQPNAVESHHSITPMPHHSTDSCGAVARAGRSKTPSATNLTPK